MSQGKSKTMPMQIFLGVEVVYYGIVQVVNILETQPTVTTASFMSSQIQFNERKHCKLSYLIKYNGNILLQMKRFP